MHIISVSHTLHDAQRPCVCDSPDHEQIAFHTRYNNVYVLLCGTTCDNTVPPMTCTLFHIFDKEIWQTSQRLLMAHFLLR